MPKANNPDTLLKLLGGNSTPTPEEFKELVVKIDSHGVLAKVFLLEGIPHVLKNSPMKYIIFREQVAERFGIGSQDVCIVGSAKLGFSPSAHQFGRPFSETSDVDVVIISEPLFYRGSRALFETLDQLPPALGKIRPYLFGAELPTGTQEPCVPLHNWRKVKEAIRNFVYENLNPGNLPNDHPLRIEIFSKIAGTAGLFLALEPRVFVSKIRCRIFRNWKAAEDYYANTLREAKNYFLHHEEVEIELDDDEPPTEESTAKASAS
jgi:hypothetical protein